MAPSTRSSAALAAALLALGATAPAAAQAPAARRTPALRLEAAATISTALVDDGNGTTVRYGLAPALAAGAGWALGASGTTGTLTLRASRAPIDVDYGALGSSSGGSGWVVDVTAGLERPVAFCDGGAARGCTSLHAGVGALWASGPDDLFPFSTETGMHVAGEIGAAIRLSAARPLHLTIAGQAFRYGGGTSQDPIDEPGTVMRLFVGVRHGR